MQTKKLPPFLLLIIFCMAVILLQYGWAAAQEGRHPEAIEDKYDDGQWVEIGSDSASGGGISNNSGESYFESLAISPDGTPIIAWGDDSSGNTEVYVRRWDGSAWVEMGSGSASGGGISNNNGVASLPSLAISPAGTPIIAWENWKDHIRSSSEIYVRRWDGASWVEMGSGSASGGGISNSSRYSGFTSLAIGPDGTPIIAWSDGPGGEYAIFVRRWDGAAWVEMGSGSASGGGISNNIGASVSRSLAISPDGTPIITWWDDSSSPGNGDVYVRRWDGSAWIEMGSGSASGGGISNTGGFNFRSSLAISPDGIPIIAWGDDSSGNTEVYVRRWDGSAWVEMGSGSASGGGITNNSGVAGGPSLAISPDGTPIITWADNSSGNWEIYVRRWDGSAWVEMGSGSASGGSISDTNNGRPSLAIGPDGMPIIAWADNSSGNREIYVRRWQQSAAHNYLPIILSSS